MEIGHLSRKKSKGRGKSPEEPYKGRSTNKRKRKVENYMKEFAEASTIHGFSQIFKENESSCHRLIWILILLLSATCAGYLAISSYLNIVKNPIAITINDTQYPLEKVWFPAVVLCPSNKIMVMKASEYLSRHLKDPTVLNQTSLNEFYKFLMMLQHPLYIQMENYFKYCKDLLPQLANVNITALMYYSLPKCEDLFRYCYWLGNETNCCRKLFSLQRSDEGFCYSFNSLTSEGLNSSCRYFDAHNVNYKGCQLEMANGYGPSTGLQVYFKVLDPKKYPALDFTDGPKIKVQVFHPNDFPQPGIFNLIPLNGMNKLNVEIKPTITMSTERIKRFTVEQRGCIFKEEVENTKIARSFSQQTCLMECRMAFMLHKCFCLPYYLNRFYNNSAPVCNSLQLKCIANASSKFRFHDVINDDAIWRGPSKLPVKVSLMSLQGELRFFLPPVGFKTDLLGSEKQLVCQNCRPTCNEVRYEVNIDATKELTYEEAKQNGFDGFIDVYYTTPGAVMYTRDVTYDFIQILANLGGIGGLFLGGSILSITEIVYWVSKAAIAFFWPRNKLEEKTVNSKIPFYGSRHSVPRLQ